MPRSSGRTPLQRPSAKRFSKGRVLRARMAAVDALRDERLESDYTRWELTWAGVEAELEQMYAKDVHIEDSYGFGDHRDWEVQIVSVAPQGECIRALCELVDTWSGYSTPVLAPEAARSLGFAVPKVAPRRTRATPEAVLEHLASFHELDLCDLFPDRAEALALWRWLEAQRTTGNIRSLAVHLLICHRFWIRSADALPVGPTDDPVGTAVRHFFGEWPIGDVLLEPWRELWLDRSHVDVLLRLPWLALALVVGRGGSLHDLSRCSLEGFAPYRSCDGRPLPRKLRLDRVPSSMDLRTALWVAELTRMGCDHREIGVLRANPAYRLHLFFWDQPPVVGAMRRTERAVLCGEEELTFWRSVVRWLLRHRSQIAQKQRSEPHWELGSVLAWARHEYTESLLEPTPVFVMDGRGFGRVVERVRRYLQQRSAGRTAARGRRWRRRGWDSFFANWAFRELVSDADLYEEGLAMDHCVGNPGFADRCARNEMVVFSVRRHGMRCFTVELDPATGAVRQAFGPSNRPLRAEEKAALERWRQSLVYTLAEQPRPEGLPELR